MMFYRDSDLFDINRVNEISYIKSVKVKKSKLSVIKSHLCLLLYPLFKKTKVRKCEVLFYGRTINNQRTFEPIIKYVRHDYFNLDNNDDPLMASYIAYSIIGVPSLIGLYLRSDSIHRKIIRTNKWAYLLSYGKLIATRKVLKKANPNLLVMANDHSPMNRCFLWNATKLGIKTVYTQHASVSNEFPPLSFDYSFLDGQVSLDSYGNKSKEGSFVFLCGPCRYDYLRKYFLKSADIFSSV